jgi:hypothetical protein
VTSGSLLEFVFECASHGHAVDEFEVAVIEATSTAGFNQAGNSGYVSFMNRYEFAGPVQPPEVMVSATVTVRYRFLPDREHRSLSGETSRLKQRSQVQYQKCRHQECRNQHQRQLRHRGG